MIDPVINGIRLNEVKINLHIYDHSNINFGIIGLCLGSSNTSRVESLDRFGKTVVDQVKIYASFFKETHSKEEVMNIQHANEFIQNMGLGDSKTCVYKFIFDENDIHDTKLYNILLCMDWDYASS